MSIGELVPSIPPSQTARAFALSGRQRALYEALSARDQRPAALYLSALMTLSQDDNPCRIHLAAHALREMINNLPQYIDVPQSAKPANIKAKVNELRDGWDTCRRKTALDTAGAWDGPVDPPLRKFLVRASAFFEWYASEQGTRYERNAVLVRALDPSEAKLPPLLEGLRVDEWSSHYDYFAKIAHLQEPVNFDGWQEALERTLLDALVPRAFDDQADIDDIIKEGEGR